jgi:CheY-like chemotaxis protein
MMAERSKRVLIVDDEEDLTWSLQKKLSKDSDKFELTCVNSGREAIEVLNQLPVDLVITDVRMPEVSGLDLLVRIKNLYPGTKVVIMTAYGTSDVQKAATDRGCFSYIEKPFEINELRELILSALTEKKGFKGSVSDFQLSDIVQLNCLGRLTSALKVKCDDEEGVIFFQDGNITHSETELLKGESAFYHIMSWQGGEFTVLRNDTPEQQTISGSWQSLLLESLRRVDENTASINQEAEIEKQKRQQRIQQVLAKIYKTEGVEHVLLHSEVGFPLFYEGKVFDKPEIISELGNHIAALYENLQDSAQFLKGDTLKFWELQFDKRIFILHKISGQDACLSIIGKETINTGFIRLEIKKNLTFLVDLL